MISEYIEQVFFIAMVVNGLLYIPQIYLLFKKKRSDEVSLTMFFMFNIIQLICILYGLEKSDHAMVQGYTLGFVTCGIVTYLIIYYRIKKR
jgi:MtN3 and saliva related transmembrane protein